MLASIIGAGFDPLNGVFNDGLDAIVGDTPEQRAANSIKSISVNGLPDAQSLIAAGEYPRRLRINGESVEPPGHPLLFEA